LRPTRSFPRISSPRRAAVGAVEALCRLLGELDALRDQVLIGLVDVVDREDAGHSHRPLGHQLTDLLGRLIVVGRRTGLLQQELVLRVSGDVHRQPTHEAEVRVGVHLEAELADVEVDRLVLVEDVNL
jgi:hypothetical protein